MDSIALEELLRSDPNIPPNLFDVFLKFWRSERSKIHEALQKKSNWNSSLKNLSWRIDVKTASRDVL